jgi:Zn-dependent peptidase ImmA (M78 family)/transcriptional regulator with XRE-family HTH domain
MGARAHTTPEVLKWARESAGYPPAVAAKKVGVKEDVLLAAEQGEVMLTLRQAERAAAAYGRSLATLMRRSPPEEPSIETKYRRLRGAPPPPWSPALVLMEREIRDRQDVTADLYAAMGERPPWHEASERLRLPRMPEPTWVAHTLSIEPYALRAERMGDIWHSRRVVLRSVEWAGVLVVRWPVPDGKTRGFVSPDPDVPAIFVNSSEDARAQTYTIVHEFAHLLLSVSGLSVVDEEAWCERYAGEVLMPEPEFTQSIARHRADSGGLAAIGEVARDFGVTPSAAASRAARLDLVTWDAARTIINRRTERPRTSGGDGNRRKVGRLSPTFTDLVLAAADSSTVTLATAASLLRTRVEDFDKLRKIVADDTAN